jgi:phosphate transport system substrate-binding protein
MLRRIPTLLFLGALSAIPLHSAPGQEQAQPEAKPDVRIAATLSTKPLVTAVARMMKQQKGLQIATSIDLTSLDALDALAQDQADLALLTRPVTGGDRAQYPALDLVETPIGMEVVALSVSDDLWDAGLRAITRKEMRAIYEKKITNWKDVGGPDEKITFFTFQQGVGIWEIFAQWLYGDNRKAPLPKLQIVATSQDARDDLEFTPGSIAPIAASLVDGSRCHALAIKFLDHSVAPTPEQLARVQNGYPIARPIIAVTIGRPTLAIRAVTEFLTGPAGQALLKSTGAMGLEAVPKPQASADGQ